MFIIGLVVGICATGAIAFISLMWVASRAYDLGREDEKLEKKRKMFSKVFAEAFTP